MMMTITKSHSDMLLHTAPGWRTMVCLTAMLDLRHPTMRQSTSTEECWNLCLEVYIYISHLQDNQLVVNGTETEIKRRRRGRGCSVNTGFSFSWYSIMIILVRAGEVVNLGKEVKKCLIESFKKVDEEFLRKATDAKPTWKVCP